MASRDITRQIAFLLTVLASSPLPGQGLALDLGTTLTGIDEPTVITHAGDGTDRLFIAERQGIIRIRKNGALLATPFLDITTLVDDSGFEEGLLGLAFHPDYETNGLFFVNYVEVEPSPPGDCPPLPATCDSNSVVARYQVSSADDDVADPASAQILFKLNEPRVNHNGGNMVFGPDGYLYIGFGDGGGGGDPYLNGQDLSTLHGAMLRIDVDGTPPAEPNDLCGENPAAYGIPADNPFVGVAGACDEIWAYGLRNPWRFSFDRDSGDLFIGDVGQNAYEEIDLQPAASEGGENYGWNCYEATHPYPGGETCSGEVVWPIIEYPHTAHPSDPTFFGESVTGGFRYRGSQFPQLRGVYLFGDYKNGKVWGTIPSCDPMAQWETQLLLDNPFLISTFGEDEGGEIYLAEYVFFSTTGKVHHLIPAAGSGGPMLAATPATLDFDGVSIGDSASLEITVSNTNSGPEALLVSDSLLSGSPDFTLDPSGGSSPCSTTTPCLAPGASCTMLATYSPAAAGAAAATLEISGNTPAGSISMTALGCDGAVDLDVPPDVVTDTRTETACATLRAGTYDVASGGDVTFQAGLSIELANGFQVSIGGTFTTELVP